MSDLDQAIATLELGDDDELCEWYRRPDLGEQASSRLQAAGGNLEESGLCTECTSWTQEMLEPLWDSDSLASHDGQGDIGSGSDTTSITSITASDGRHQHTSHKTYGQLRGDASFCALCRAIQDSVVVTQRYAAGHYVTHVPPDGHVRLVPNHGLGVKLSGFFVRVVQDENMSGADYYPDLGASSLGFLEVQVRETEPVRVLDSSSSSDAINGLEIITIQGTSFRKAVPCRDMTQLLHLWLRQCDSTHGLCRDHKNSTDAGTSASPTRLLEIKRVGRLFHIRLVAGNENRTRYVALSHRWGDYTSIRTTTLNIESYRSGINFDSLSLTLQQAVQITYAAGVRHLWIDCLCIIQDDDSDWALEAPRMGSIYANAYFTIAASAFEDAGCFPLKFSENHRVTIDIHPGLELNISPHSSDFNGQTIRQEHLQKRGWTLQERLLSQRILYCSRYEYYWLCRKQRLRAWGDPDDWSAFWSVNPGVGSDQYPLLLSSSTQSRRAALTKWYLLLCEYSNRQLTLEKDKLIAINGLVDIFQRWIGSRYLYGLWECDLACGLVWYMRGHWFFDDSGQRQEVKAWRVRPTRAPSWSWASMDGLQEHPGSDFNRFAGKSLRERVHVKATIASDDEHRSCLGGDLSAGSQVLKISGRLSKAFCGYENAGEPAGRRVWQINLKRGPQAFVFHADDPNFNSDEHIADAESSRLFVLPVIACIGLVITPASDDDVPLYRRVGAADFYTTIRFRDHLDGDKSEGSTAGTADGDTEHATVQTDDRATEAQGSANETDAEAFDEGADAASYTEGESSSTENSIKSEGQSDNGRELVDPYMEALADELRWLGLGQSGVSETFFLR